MAFKTLSKTYSKSAYTTQPCVRVGKTDSFSLNKAALELLPADTEYVDFAIDEDARICKIVKSNNFGRKLSPATQYGNKYFAIHLFRKLVAHPEEIESKAYAVFTVPDEDGVFFNY